MDWIYVAQDRAQRESVINTVINIREPIKRREFSDQITYSRLHSIGFLCFVQRTFCIGFGLYSAFLFLFVLSTVAVWNVPANRPSVRQIRGAWGTDKGTAMLCRS